MTYIKHNKQKSLRTMWDRAIISTVRLEAVIKRYRDEKLKDEMKAKMFIKSGNALPKSINLRKQIFKTKIKKKHELYR